MLKIKKLTTYEKQLIRGLIGYKYDKRKNLTTQFIADFTMSLVASDPERKPLFIEFIESVENK